MSRFHLNRDMYPYTTHPTDMYTSKVHPGLYVVQRRGTLFKSSKKQKLN